MSSRQANSSSGEDLAVGESSNGNRVSPSSLSQQRNTRRSNSAMSSTRTRGGISKEEDDGDQQDEGEIGIDVAMTAEPEEEEEMNDNGDSGDSGNSAYPSGTTRSRRNASSSSSKRKRGGANTTAANRTRAGKRSRQPTADDQVVGLTPNETTIKSEVEDESTHTIKSTSESGEEGMTRAGSKEGASRISRQRSASGIKELAGLGLRTLGNGEEEPLVPRRTRRGGNSPNEGQSHHKEGEEKRESGSEDTNEGEDKNKRSTRNGSSEAKGIAKEDQDQDEVNEEEVTEEGVTRCLCGSADENVGLMIQCETCKCWQHCICMGMRTEEDCPDVYFCEQCRPELHIDLLRLLGFLPTSRNGKKGGNAKTQSGRINAKDAAKELKDAKDAVLSLAKENERRRKEGREPVTGWSVAQEQEQIQLQEQQQQHPMQSQQSRSTSSGHHRRQASESQPRASRSQSRDELTIPKSPPKRRSTMNSRDSAYGWETIPTGLLNEEDEEGQDEEDEEVEGGQSRKRKRGGLDENGEMRSPSPLGLNSDEGVAKKRRTSSTIIDEEEQGEGDEEEEKQIDDAANSQGFRKATTVKTRPVRDHDTSRPKHPNQYTARRAAAAAAVAAAANATQSGSGNAGSSSSPSPSPSKHRMADGSRRGTTLRDVITNGSRMATPTPGDTARSNNPSIAWSMPDHLSHLAYLLPSHTGPEPLQVNVASTKGMTITSNSKGASSTAIKDANTDRIIQASPQAFQMISLVEPNTKIKFPGKRTTLGEMKKRVRNILEFVSRLQVESAERERRMKFLGISSKDSDGEMTPEDENRSGNGAEGPSMALLEEANAGDGKEQDQDGRDDGIKAEEVKSTSPTVNDPLATSTSIANDSSSSSSDNSLKRFTKLHSSSMSLVDELTRELLNFQQKYGSTSNSSAAMASSSSIY